MWTTRTQDGGFGSTCLFLFQPGGKEGKRGRGERSVRRGNRGIRQWTIQSAGQASTPFLDVLLPVFFVLLVVSTYASGSEPPRTAQQQAMAEGLLTQPGARILAEYVPSSDQRPHQPPQHHAPGDGFDAKASLTYTLLDETLGPVSSSDAWRSGGASGAQTIAQDVVKLGPFAALHRFEPLTRQQAALHGADGLLGLSFSSLPDSASLLDSMFHHQRASWHIEQPPSFRELRPRLFA
eukprot:CAMPEP_0181300454 /NCGR_PEP_ID=MMETSP1101-20121128/6898_1 /TAXON_ID=46948 /ORGANISM="Rhodomonas abbreviata, Strain Caron Lab Isolate" /LENGTH=236 /DNA_ID=CAMNT_0023405691 /DNA_START=270 /DNA_END=977 /DNA_ORIENTATION=-